MPRDVDLIVIHCSASPDGVSLIEGKAGEPGFCTAAQVIDRWHARRGFERNRNWRHLLNWSLPHIGYHFVVNTNGGVETGRHLDEIGAHVAGFNKNSIGICQVGTDRFSARSWRRLADVVRALKVKYPAARVCGHRDLSPDQDRDGVVESFEWLKTCPGFDVAAWLALAMLPDPKHLLTEAV